MNTTAQSTDAFLAAVKNRRSYYAISKQAVVPDARIEEILREAILHVPSSFNSQSTRLVLLLGAEHDKLWDIAENTLRKLVNDAEKFASTEEKMKAFRNGYGTVLYFEDHEPVKQLQANFASYADRFPVWSEHTSAMHQFVVWTALEAEGFGASLQHYNPLIDDEVKATWKLPDSWKLVAQMPFGKPEADPGDKPFQSVEERMRVFK